MWHAVIHLPVIVHDTEVVGLEVVPGGALVVEEVAGALLVVVDVVAVGLLMVEGRLLLVRIYRPLPNL